MGVCPAQALRLPETELEVDQDKCTLCLACISFCPVKALSRHEGGPPERRPEAERLRAEAVIVGAGPAGSICARDLARAGVNVLVVEKKQEIGVPKRCAEAVEPGTFEAADIEPHPLWLVNRIEAAVLYAPNGRGVRFGTSIAEKSGWIIERKIFEKHLAKDAIRAGARYRLKTTALGVVRENGRVAGIAVTHGGRTQVIEAKIVIAADGVDSLMAKSAGLDTVNRLTNYMSCFQYEMAGLRDIDDRAIHLFYGNDIAPGGYAWIFPKGSSIANVGVGVKVSKAGKRTAQDCLDQFIEKHPRHFQGASAIEFNCGGVPVRQTAEALTGDGLMIVGDAAQLVNPITGGGIHLALLSGRMAADIAAEALRKGDVRREQLSAYERRWRAQQGKMLEKMSKLQRFTEKLSDADLNGLADILTGKTLEEMALGRFSGFVALLLKKLPSLVPLGLKYLKS